MLLLILFAFFAGIVTILSPCILPILPIVLSGSVTGGKRKPYGIVTGFVGSFTFFTLFLSAIVSFLHISADILRVASITIVFVFGLSLIIPQIQVWIELFFSRISGRFSAKEQKDGFIAGIIVGLSLGLLWTPCVGPILASVISLALTGSVNAQTFLITLAYSLGTAIPMLIITSSGRALFQRVPWLISQSKHIQQFFGVIMILTALALMFNIDRRFQVWILQTFPSYGSGLTSFEENPAIKNQLEELSGRPLPETKGQTGKPMFSLLEDLGKAPEIVPGGNWFNLPKGENALTIKGLRGKVVLVDFWTYSCINCIRTLPYLKDWYQKYADKGFVIIGVHSPEFEFEKNSKNVEQAIKDFGIEYPVVQDNDFQTWQAFGDNRWPRHYLIDKEGEIREFHAGEGKYAETEQNIQTLLNEMGTNVTEVPINEKKYSINTNTPETYLGFARFDESIFASTQQIEKDTKITFTAPESLLLNQMSFSGNWMLSDELATPSKNAEIQYHYDAQNVFLVMRPKKNGVSGTIEVTLDGKAVNTVDVKNGLVTIDKDRLYTLIQEDRQGQHTIRIRFLDENVEVFAFTFG